MKKYENSLDKPKLSRWQRLEPVDSGEVWTCPHCNKRFRLLHLLHGKNRHRFIEYFAEGDLVYKTEDDAKSVRSGSGVKTGGL